MDADGDDTEYNSLLEYFSAFAKQKKLNRKLRSKLKELVKQKEE